MTLLISEYWFFEEFIWLIMSGSKIWISDGFLLEVVKELLMTALRSVRKAMRLITSKCIGEIGAGLRTYRIAWFSLSP